MNGKQFVMACSVYFVLNGMCLAAQGTLEIRGRIVESSCVSHADQSAMFELKDCPSLSREPAVHVNRIDPLSSVNAPDNSQVNARLVTDSGRSGRYYNQQYLLVDDGGSPIHSGTYAVTLTTP